MAEERPATSVSPENKELSARVERAELEKRLATAEREVLDAQLPKSDTKGQDGSVTLKEGAGYYAELLAYRTLGVTARSIAETVKAKASGATVVLSDQFDLATNDTLWQMIDLRLSDIDKRLRDVLKLYGPDEAITRFSTVGAALIAAPAILGAAADIAAFFRVSREIVGRQVTLSSRALLAETAQALLQQGTKVVTPDLKVGGEKGTLIARLSQIQDTRREVMELRLRLRNQIGPNQDLLARIEAELTAKRTELATLKMSAAPAQQTQPVEEQIEKLATHHLEEAEKIEQWKRVTEGIDPLLQELTDLTTMLTSRPASQTQSPLEAVAAVDVIRSLHGDTKLLAVSIVSQGTEIEITKTSWTQGRISYIGGSVVTYFLFDKAGTLELAGTIPRHETASFKGREGATAL